MNTPKNPHLNQATQKTICQIFLPKKSWNRKSQPPAPPPQNSFDHRPHLKSEVLPPSARVSNALLPCDVGAFVQKERVTKPCKFVTVRVAQARAIVQRERNMQTRARRKRVVIFPFRSTDEEKRETARGLGLAKWSWKSDASRLGLSYKSQNWKKWTKFEFWARSGWSQNVNVREIILLGELTSHAFYSWASGSDIWGNPIPHYDTNNLIGLDWIGLYCIVLYCIVLYP